MLSLLDGGLYLANPRSSLGQLHAEEWASLCQLGPHTTFLHMEVSISTQDALDMVVHLCPSLRPLGNPALLLCVHVGCHGCWPSCCLPAKDQVGPYRMYPTFFMCPPVITHSEPTSSWSSPGNLCITMCKCVQHMPLLVKENRGDSTCCTCLHPCSASTPSPSHLPLCLLPHS